MYRFMRESVSVSAYMPPAFGANPTALAVATPVCVTARIVYPSPSSACVLGARTIHAFFPPLGILALMAGEPI